MSEEVSERKDPIITIEEFTEEEKEIKKEKDEKPKQAKTPVSNVISILALVLAGASLVVTLVLNLRSVNQPITIRNSDSGGNNTSFIKEGSIADVASKVSKSVVSIVTETRTMSWYGQSSTSSAAGTGIIVTGDGFILTNRHVIENSNKIEVIMSDGTTFRDVKVETVDPLNDIAFLKISNVSDLPVATLGESKTIKAGQEVIAIGNALGQFSNSVTMGIISGLGRTIVATDQSSSSYETLSDMIQTDAAINAGNSGGPLVNAAGEVIGINSATSGSGEGIGFAIPITSVKGMLTQLINTGTAKRTFLGVTSVQITPSVAEEYELPVVSGAYLISSSNKYSTSAIQKDSPAYKAGLKDKDIITAINDEKIGSSGSLSTLIGQYCPGDTVRLSIIRNGSEQTLDVTLGAYQDK